MHKFLAAAAASLAIATAAQSAPITFFAEDLSGDVSAVSGTRSAFLGTLAGGVGTEDFEAPTALPNIGFTGSTGNITATLTGGATTIQSSNGFGRFATSGTNYVQTGGGGDFNISFSSAIAAFGFYGTDIGDVGNSLILQLTAEGGAVTTLNVGNTQGSGTSTNGSVLFFGFIDTVTSYTSIAFLNQPGGTDIFGFDDMTVGDTQQIVDPPAVPLPAAGWLLLGALSGLGLTKRRKKA